MDTWDVTVVGGGILGTSLAFWLANRYGGRIAVIEREAEVAEHTSRRNTGVIHRPFYLDPVGRRVFARCAQTAYGMWKSYAAERGLPWSPVQTLEVATEDWMAPRLEQYYHWGQENGMAPEELEVLSREDVRRLEPNVESHGAIWSKTDTAVDYRAFTQTLRADAEREGATFVTRAEVSEIRPDGDSLEVLLRPNEPDFGDISVDPRRRIRLAPTWLREPIRTRFLINAAGGNSIDIAHMMGVGTEYTDLHFRGEYWVVAPAYSGLARRNIYTVARHPDLPFLDPHWIHRANGRAEIGPNAAPVAGPHTYSGFFNDPKELVEKILERPWRNKLALLFSPDFLSLAAEEWASSISKRVMANRARKFLPSLQVDYLTEPGTAGIRASVIDRNGAFIKEAIELEGPRSFHINNYNSPGATGAPAFGAWVIAMLAGKGFLDHLTKKSSPSKKPWDLDVVLSGVAG